MSVPIVPSAVRSNSYLWERSFYDGHRLQAEVQLFAAFLSHSINIDDRNNGVSLIHRSYGIAFSKQPDSEFSLFLNEHSASLAILEPWRKMLPIADIPDSLMLWFLYYKLPALKSYSSTHYHRVFLRFLHLISFRYPYRLDLICLSLIQDRTSAVFAAFPKLTLTPQQCFSRSESFLPQFQVLWTKGLYESMWLLCLRGQIDGRNFPLTDHIIRGFSVIGESKRSFRLFRQLYSHDSSNFQLTSISNLFFMALGSEEIDHAFLDTLKLHFQDLASKAFSACEPTNQNLAPQPLHINEKPVLVVSSSDLRQHPVGRFWLPIARHLRSKFKVVSIAGHPHESDPIRDELRGLSDEWLPMEASDVTSMFTRIRNLAPSLLLDLGGHTADNHPEFLSHRLANVQISYLGFYGPSYASCCDWWVVDQVLMTWIAKSYPNSEPLWPLPGPSLCYQPELHNLPDLDAIVYRESNYLTFGSFNHTRKLTSVTRKRIIDVLTANPDVVLQFRSHSFRDPSVRNLFLSRFIDSGISPHQLQPLPFAATYREAMFDFARINLHLDTSPVSGTTTTLDSLAMGIPVLSSPTPYYAGAISAAILHHAGLAEHVCNDPNLLPSQALQLATRFRTARARKELGNHVRNSAICDTDSTPKMFVDQLGLMLRQKQAA